VRVEVLAGRFAVCRLDPRARWPCPEATAPPSGFFSVTRTDAELSIVCEESVVPAECRNPGLPHGAGIERGFRLLRVAGPLPFDAVGVLASLTAPLAAARVSLLSLSTYDTDYLLVRAADLATALAALRAAGHETG
jgi:hypothetical protein